jgi:putative phage-type endonuclease
VVIDLTQGSDAWKEWRRLGVGGSDAPIILGLSKYMTRQELLEEKITGVSKRKNDFVLEKGHEFEAKIRAKYELTTDGDFPPTCFQSDVLEWLRVSLDGYNRDTNTAWEIKWVGKNNVHVEISPSHYCQCQHELMVSGASQVLLLRGNTADDIDEQIIKPNIEYQKMLMIVESNFVKELKKGVKAISKVGTRPNTASVQ